jgi:hypothetical protein
MVKSQAKRDALRKNPHKKRMGKHKRVARDHFDHSTPLPNVKVPAFIIKDILDKKDLLVSPDLTHHLVLRYLRKQPKLLERLYDEKILRSAEYEKLKKWVRQELRVLVGMFVLESNVEKLVHEPTSVILANHRSTAERQQFYPELYEQLFQGKKPEAILDLAAGLNPCSYEYLGCKPIYYAVDVSPQLMDFVQTWFDVHKITGKAWSADVTQLKEFPKTDTVFLFKATDVMERVKYGFGEELLALLKDRRIIVSFATATISGNREIAVKKRSWVERWAEQNNKSVRTYDTPNERYYILE